MFLLVLLTQQSPGKRNAIKIIGFLLLYCIYGGVINGIGAGLVFSRNGSTGGTDIITMVIRKKHPNFEIGTVNFYFNLIIVAIIWF